jgi:hypothetical protein
MKRRTVFCVLVLMVLAGGALAQETAPTPAPAEPAPQATPAPPPAEPAPQAAPAPPPAEPAAPTAPAAAPAPAAAVPAAAVPAPAPAAQAAPAPVTVPRVYFEKAAVIVDGKADYNGALELEWKPVNGDGKLIQVNVLAKSKDKDIAGDIYKELVLAAGNSYKIKQSGEKIQVKKGNKQAPNFAITITKLQVPGVSLRVEKN